jgi:hypothetical protein
MGRCLEVGLNNKNMIILHGRTGTAADGFFRLACPLQEDAIKGG